MGIRRPGYGLVRNDLHILLFFAYTVSVFNPDAHLPRLNRSLVYLGACVIAGIRLARESQVNVRVLTTTAAIRESVDLSHAIFNHVFRKTPEEIRGK